MPLVSKCGQTKTKNVYYYNVYGNLDLNDASKDNGPFSLAIQRDWQLYMMVRHGHWRAILIDATFDTNEPKE